MVGAVGFTNSLHTETLLPKSLADFEIDPTNRANRANPTNPPLMVSMPDPTVLDRLCPLYQLSQEASFLSSRVSSNNQPQSHIEHPHNHYDWRKVHTFFAHRHLVIEAVCMSRAYV